MEAVHYSFFLTISFYAIYYLGMQTILLKRGPVPRIGNNVCYGYPPLLVSVLTLIHCIFLAGNFYLLIFGPFLGHWAFLISIICVSIGVYSFLWLRDLFCRIFLHKDGLLQVYLDGRVINLPFTEFKTLEIKKLYCVGSLVYGVKSLDESRVLLFHSSLMAHEELIMCIKDKVTQLDIPEHTN